VAVSTFWMTKFTTDTTPTATGRVTATLLTDRQTHIRDQTYIQTWNRTFNTITFTLKHSQMTTCELRLSHWMQCSIQC